MTSSSSHSRHQPTPSTTTVTQSVPSHRQDLIQHRAPTNQTSDLFPTPSSSSAGFFQSPPIIQNQLHDDLALRRALTLFLPTDIRESITPDLHRFADRVLSREILGWVLDAEKNPPYLRTWDTWGRRVDELVTSEGWRRLQDEGIREGIVALGYEGRAGEYGRVWQMAKLVVWSGSAAWVNCPSQMVDGVVTLVRRELMRMEKDEAKRKVLRSAYERLISREIEGEKKAWTTGQWMTERQGGSDVSMTESLATYSEELARGDEVVKASDGNMLGPWLINGFKWFSSATDADCMVLLARTQRGISTFLAPMRRTLEEKNIVTGRDTELNGVHIQRLKNKLGTRALPTAELELKGVRAWLIGEEGKGTKEMATVLNVARIHNAVTATGLWGRGLSVIRAYAWVRKVGSRPLSERPGYMRGVARMHVQYRADVLFNMFVAGLLGMAEQKQVAAFEGSTRTSKVTGNLPGIKDEVQAEWMLRILTPALKGVCGKTAIAGLQECMECMGGVGYLENEDMQFNIARLYRDANVIPIWEGTTDMMADDSIVRVLYRKTRDEVMTALTKWVQSLLEHGSAFDPQKNAIEEWWLSFRMMIDQASKEEAEMKARAIMEKLVDVVQGLLLLADAQSDEDQVAVLVLEAFVAGQQGKGIVRAENQWRNEVERDTLIVFGAGEAATNFRQAKL